MIRRDTDCLAAIAAGLCGAVTGIQTVPNDWPAQVEEAEKDAPDTVSNRSCKKTADGIYDALKKEMARIETQIEQISRPCRKEHAPITPFPRKRRSWK